MSGADAALSAFIQRVRGLRTLAADAAKLAAPLVEAAAKKTAAAGVTPDGIPWAPKKGGGRALVHAANALSARALGPAVVLTLKGVEVLQNFGTTRLPARQILPEGGAGVPKAFADALAKASETAFARAMGGG
ncbi:MAG TPA: hypothetical protein VF765_31120 [Polyangiaceae bacterium]